MRRYDVSMPLFAGMPAFPGDPEFASSPTHAIERGDPYRVSRLTFGSHSGTHVDPPSHFLPEGAPIDRVDLAQLNGPCEVVQVPPGSPRVGSADVASVARGTERVLLRTSNSDRWARSLSFFPDYVALALDGARTLLERGVRLVGIDSLSIESDPTGTFPVHHLLLGSGALIVEGLLLGDVPAGRYELSCLPLRIRGGDGGPARVILRTP